jgi:hypothetical protein
MVVQLITFHLSLKKIAASSGVRAATIETIFQLFHNSSQRNEKQMNFKKFLTF